MLSDRRWYDVLFCLISLCSSALLGCGGNTNSKLFAVTPSLSVNPENLDFGQNVSVNSARTLLVTLTNRSSFPTVITSVKAGPADFSVLHWTGPATLLPRQSIVLQVSFQPHDKSSYHGILEVFGSYGNVQWKGLSSTSLRAVAYQRVLLQGMAAVAHSKVSISPASVTLQSGASQLFSASVTGNNNDGVTWSASLGTITSSGIYTAPTVTSTTKATVVATSASDPTKYATSLVTISPLPSNSSVTVSVLPSSVTIQAGSSKQFLASVTGTQSIGVIWSAALGAISSTGVYTAPEVSTTTPDTVTAVLMGDQTKYDSSQLTIVAPTAAVQYWVSNSGSDSNDGSQAHPWKTIQHAVSNFVLGAAGTVIHVSPGTYVPFTVSRGGSSNNSRLSLVCDQQWSYPSGSGCLIRGGWVLLGAADYFDLGALGRFGFDVQPPETSGTAIYGSNTIAQGHLNYVHIYGNYVHDFAHEVTGNTTGGINWPTGCPSDGAISVGQHPSNGGWIITGIEISGNRVENYAIPGPNCNQAHGFYVMSPGVRVEDNLLVNAGGSSINYYDSACDAVISNNTVINAYAWGILLDGTGLCSAPGNNTVTNNIVVGTWGSWGCALGANQWGTSASSARPSLWANNLSFNNVNGAYCFLSRYDTVSEPISFDPLFVSAATNDYHLQPGSPATGAGQTNCVPGGLAPCAPQVDLDGRPRSNSSPSLGAYE